MVQRHKHIEESIKHILNDAEKQLEHLIYEFVYDLALPAPEFSYYFEILSQDDKFMTAVERLYEKRRKDEERLSRRENHA